MGKNKAQARSWGAESLMSGWDGDPSLGSVEDAASEATAVGLRAEAAQTFTRGQIPQASASSFDLAECRGVSAS